MVDFVRTPDSHFEALDWEFAPHYFDHPDGLRQHYVDEQPGGPSKGTFLLVHGEPTWAYLYKDWIPTLVAAGYRVVVPDHLGFGRSDKPTDDNWYRISEHRARFDALVAALDLRDIHLVVQDWGGPIGLCNAYANQDRCARIFILNTWLHDDTFVYGDGIRWWRQAALDPEQLGGDMPVGRIVAGTMRRPDHDSEALMRAFDAPYTGSASKAGARRFPVCIPFGEPDLGDAALQAEVREAFRHWTSTPVHIAFGDADPVFTFDWAQQWAAEIPGATLDRIENAGHFLQIDAPADCLAIIARHCGF